MPANFDAALLRLKGALQVQTDKQVAALLGMSATALNDRKKRDSFPEDRVRALADKLLFDADYVLTGVARAALEIMEAVRVGAPFVQIGPEDQALLFRWHSCSSVDQKLLMSLLKRLTAATDPLDESGRYKAREPASNAVQETRKKAL
jgi:hypothetical protein